MTEEEEKEFPQKNTYGEPPYSRFHANGRETIGGVNILHFHVHRRKQVANLQDVFRNFPPTVQRDATWKKKIYAPLCRFFNSQSFSAERKCGTNERQFAYFPKPRIFTQLNTLPYTFRSWPARPPANRLLQGIWIIGP